MTRIARRLIALPFLHIRLLGRFVVDWFCPTYIDKAHLNRLVSLFRKNLNLEEIKLDHKQVLSITELYLKHRFDLLGSGWVAVKYGMQCRGTHGFRYSNGPEVDHDLDGVWLKARVNPGNLARVRRIWRLVDSGYTPIDWQIDFKSGYRWRQKRWYLYVPLGNGGGVDIKVPWELARMQHLVQFAWAFALARSERSEFRDFDVYQREFRNQILDFCASNPPRFGVNWLCTMDVAIRAANWVIAYQLFKGFGAEFDAEFEAVLANSVFDHARHIMEHLEWFEHGRGNHYLANISGLIFAAAALPTSKKTEAWLAFGAEELLKEVEHQFHKDGTGAEASTAYHCLCAEMVTFASAVLLGLPKSVQERIKSGFQNPGELDVKSESMLFPQWYIERLEKMAEFVIAITKSTNTITQIGDNDSGRLFKLFPLFQETTAGEAKRRFDYHYCFEDINDEDPYLVAKCLDRRHVVAGIDGLFKRTDFEKFSEDVRGYTRVIVALSGGTRLKSHCHRSTIFESAKVRIGDHNDRLRLIEDWEKTEPSKRSITRFRLNRNVKNEIVNIFGFPDFGLYIFRARDFYLSVRCGAMGKNVVGAHAHNDQLSLELNVDGEDVVRDPGTYLYTPVPEIRNRYRSITAHFSPQAKKFEPSALDEHLFYLDYKNEGECLYFGSLGFVGRHQGSSFAFYRSITLGVSGVTVQDWSKSHHLVGVEDIHQPEFSPAYGVRDASRN